MKTRSSQNEAIFKVFLFFSLLIFASLVWFLFFGCDLKESGCMRQGEEAEGICSVRLLSLLNGSRQRVSVHCGEALACPCHLASLEGNSFFFFFFASGLLF